MPVKPPASKHTSQDLGDKLFVSMPGPRLKIFAAFFVIWLVMWLIFEVVIIGAFFVGREQPDAMPIPILVVFLLVWTMVGLLMLWSAAWAISGRELLTITDQAIVIKRAAMGLGFSKEYSGGYVKDLRVTSANMNLNSPMMAWLQVSYSPRRDSFGSIAFDYGAGTFRFGAGIDEAEAKQIVAEIQNKFPQYRSNDFSRS